ncbi:MAG: DUF3800 domain-containing protein [Bacilli bacterium]
MAWYEKPTILAKINKNQNYAFLDESGDIKDLKTVIKKIEESVYIARRDSNFIITGIYVDSKKLEYIYAAFSNFKMKHFGNKNPLHATEVFNDKKTIIATNTSKQEFIDELNGIISSFRYRIVATAFNKVDYVKKHQIKDSSIALSIIREIYKRQFMKMEDMLKELNRTAFFVVEESSNPKIDKIILDLFVFLRKRKRLVNAKKLYFTKKSASCYPVGIELADFSSRAIYSYFRNTEFINVLKKVYKSDFVYNKYIEFFDKPIKKPAMVSQAGRRH